MDVELRSRGRQVGILLATNTLNLLSTIFSGIEAQWGRDCWSAREALALHAMHIGWGSLPEMVERHDAGHGRDTAPTIFSSHPLVGVTTADILLERGDGPRQLADQTLNNTLAFISTVWTQVETAFVVGHAPSDFPQWNTEQS